MKKIRLFLACLTLLFLMSVPVMAASDAADDRTLINPLYSEEDLSVSVSVEEMESQEECVGTYSTVPYYSSVKNAGVYLRTKMLNRTSGVNFRVYSTKTNWKEVLMDIVNQACVATDETAPNAGDYLRWHFYSFTSRLNSNEIRTTSASGYYYTFNGIFIYMSNASQEQWMNNRVKTLLSQLGVDKMKREYDIIRAVYIYITQNVSYDYANLNNEDNLGKYSAYSALRYNSAICQGYANLMYRLLREAGLSVRFIGGYSQGEGHAWNIVRIGSRYYNMDSTWDAGNSPENFKYFLKGGTWSQFNHDHTRDDEYRTNAFNSLYPMSSVPYTATTSSAIAYKITYHLNGGVNNKNNPSKYFQNDVTLKNPTREGYLFKGWYKDSSFTSKITKISRTSACNYVLYAKWEKVTVNPSSIKYYKSDGVGLRVYFSQVENADGYRIAYSHSSSFAAGTVKYAYVEAGKDAKLIRQNDCYRRYYVRIQAYRCDSANKKIFSKYSKAISGYVVKYELNGGKNANTNPYYFYHRGTVLANPVKEGYQFVGWYTDQKCTKKVTTIPRTTGRGLVLYAKWK